MKRHLIISGFIFLTMTLLNFIGGLVNSNVGHSQGSLLVFPVTLIFVAFFCGFYLLTTIINIRLDVAYRLPVIRTIFWTLLVTLDILFQREGILETIDYILALTNGGLCLFYNTLLFTLYNGGTGNTYFEIYGFGIVAFAIFEFLVIKTSTIITDKIIKQKL